MAGKKGMKQFGAVIINEVLAMREQGKTQLEIAEHFGFQDKYPIKRLLERHYRKQRSIVSGNIPRKQGRPRKFETETQTSPDSIIKQLKMENELLRSFLSEVGRR